MISPGSFTRRLLAAGVLAAVTIPLGAASAALAAPAPAGQRALGSQADQLNSIACRSASNCLAVGADYHAGTPLAEIWNGTRWRAVRVKLPAGASGALLNAVACPPAARMYCVVVGVVLTSSTAEGLTESWNGKGWTLMRAPATAGSRLEAVSCLSPKRCVAVGAGSASHGIGALLAESWNGRSWTREKISAPAHTHGGFLDGVSCPATGFCAATGAVFAGSNRAESPLIEGWNGAAWAAMKPAKPKTSIQTGLYAVSCPSSTSCVAVGSGGGLSSGSIAYAEAWNGRTWALTSKVPSPKGTRDPWLYGVSCRAARHCLAVGLTDWNPASNATLSGRASVATWNGKVWRASVVAVPGTGNASGFAGVTCRPGSKVFCAAVGFAGPQGSTVSGALSGFWNGRRWRVVLPSQ